MDSADGSFVGVVSVGLTGSINWYSDGSLITMGSKKYPFNATDHYYYDYDTKYLMRYESDEGEWIQEVYAGDPFDQVPPNVVTYLTSNNYTLNQAP